MPRKKEPHLTNTVRDLRARADGLTQRDLAERVGVTRQTIIALEAGAYVPSLVLAMRIARVFGRRVEEVFVLDD